MSAVLAASKMATIVASLGPRSDCALAASAGTAMANGMARAMAVAVESHAGVGRRLFVYMSLPLEGGCGERRAPCLVIRQAPTANLPCYYNKSRCYCSFIM